MRLAALCLALAACKASPKPNAVEIGTLLVSRADVASRPELASSAEEVRAALATQLQATGRFAVRPGAKGRISLSIERAEHSMAPLAFIDGGSPPIEREMAEVVVSLELSRPKDHDLHAEGLARRPIEAEQSLESSARNAAFAAALDTALYEAAAALADQMDERAKNDDAVVADLRSTEPRIRDYAIRVLSERRNPAAVPALIARLSDPEPSIWLRAVGALTIIGDRRAVGPLIDLTRKRRPEDAGPLIYAIGTLGGPEAEAYLFTLESGAPDEGMRRAAREAYAELLRNKREDGGSRAKHP
jgi:hypothetical protein